MEFILAWKYLDKYGSNLHPFVNVFIRDEHLSDIPEFFDYFFGLYALNDSMEMLINNEYWHCPVATYFDIGMSG